MGQRGCRGICRDIWEDIAYIIVGLLIPFRVYFRWTTHPVIVTIGDNKHYIKVLLYSYYTTITGWGVLLGYIPQKP